MKTIKILLFATFTSSLLGFTSCLDAPLPQSADETVFEKIEKIAIEPTISDNAISSVDALVTAYLSNTSFKVNSSQNIPAPQPTVTKISEGDEFPKVYVIDFGTGYNDAKNNLFKGTITYTRYSYKESRYDFDNLFVNNSKIEGYKKSKIDETNSELNIILQETIKDENLNTVSTRNSERNRLLLSDNGTPKDYTDDSFRITGSTMGTVLIDGKEYSYNYDITNPIETLSNYKYFVKGITKLTIGSSIQIIDYGNGEKDNNAKVTRNGKTMDVTLNWD